MKVYFPKTMVYNERVFKANEIYDLSDERPNFIERWLKRGCTIIKEEEKELKHEDPVLNKNSKQKKIRKPKSSKPAKKRNSK